MGASDLGFLDYEGGQLKISFLPSVSSTDRSDRIIIISEALIYHDTQLFRLSDWTNLFNLFEAYGGGGWTGGMTF